VGGLETFWRPDLAAVRRLLCNVGDEDSHGVIFDIMSRYTVSLPTCPALL
jgi:hypothetical protein